MFPRIVVLSLLAVISTQAAPPNVKTDDVAGNEAVRKIMETYGGRGVLSDNTPPTPPAAALKLFKSRSDVAVDLIANEPEVVQPLYMSCDTFSTSSRPGLRW